MVDIHKGSPSGPKALQKIVAALVDTACAANTTTEVVVTVPGVKATDIVNAVPAAALTAGISMVVALVAANAVTLRFNNPTVGTVQTGAINVNFSVNSYS